TRVRRLRSGRGKVMPILVRCPTCGTQLRTHDTAAGRVVLCPKCQATFPVPTRAEGDADGEAPLAEVAETAPAERAFCPWCDEEVSPAARKCRHCGEVLDVELRRQQARERRAKRRDRGQFLCPFCHTTAEPYTLK